MIPSVSEFQKAFDAIRNIIVKTPLVALHTFENTSLDIFVKPEIHQVVNSFKIRGVFHAVASLSEERRQCGVSTVSAGNTAQALAWAARFYGVSARCIMPEHAPITKVEAVQAYGATPVLLPTPEVFRYLKEHLWEQEPYAFIHPWTNRDVMTGHGSIGFEILEDMPDVDSVFIPVGGGGLISGVAGVLKQLRPSLKIFAVEPEGCPALYTSLENRQPSSVSCDTICDGVAVPYITEEMYPILKKLVDEVVLVSEKDVKSTIRYLALHNKMIVEGSGALAVAAALKISQKKRGKSVCLLTGGSIDIEKFIAIVTEN